MDKLSMDKQSMDKLYPVQDILTQDIRIEIIPENVCHAGCHHCGPCQRLLQAQA
jgi:hypothetical protein